MCATAAEAANNSNTLNQQSNAPMGINAGQGIALQCQAELAPAAHECACQHQQRLHMLG
eukprot:CAMPEP_0177513022 /NCGR_PEP_ID=MMETSP0369-20130122/43543_1 /TAXON_ID=447022 ORGANISM="Scrippsiella hangoei-like, Strain SHHI-4" /NCGR_SAMPLE_ID=MMETSP0369 /ASSEMBLY_ACC=CAM_ASM_000364 /LENGTH=58 /DNA_ID=CAMNT_0018991581 /DNA_START=152 /DNA_END=324 /DNA_ORIENTATION=+